MGALASSSSDLLYYAFGNTSPLYVFPGIPRDAKSANVLLLACGDLRSAFYSLSRDSSTRVDWKDIHFFVNDSMPSIIARNLVLIWLIRRKRVSAETLFQVWFSLRLGQTAYLALCDAVLALVGKDAEHELQLINVTFHTPTDWCKVHAVLSKWIEWQDDLSWNHVRRIREEALTTKGPMPMPLDEMATSVANIVHLKYSKIASGDMNFPTKAAAEEVKRYIVSGVVTFRETPEYTNPTLFLRPETFNLHYGSDPFSAFSKFARNYDERVPLKTMCLAEMTDWIQAVQQHSTKVTWTFSTSDCIALATDLSGPFDVVSTSNVADGVGLLPLLQSLRGITIPNGYLLTQTLRSYQYSSSIDEYLKKNLILSSEFHASVLGWRCVGHEGDLKAENGDIQFIFPNIPEIVLASSSKESRCERNLLWTPAPWTNAPLDLSADNSVRQIVGHLRSELVQLPFSSARLCRFRPSWMQAHILTLLPMFLSGVHADESIVEKKEQITELMDLVKCLRLEDASGLSLIRVRVSDDVMRASFEVSHRILGQLEFVALLCSNGETFPYWALFNEYDADSVTSSSSSFG